MIVFSTDTFSSTQLNNNSIISGFTTKINGDTRQKEVIIDYLHQKHISYKKVIIPHQVHETSIAVVDEQSPDELDGTDGLVTRSSGVVLLVKTADCVPLLFVDKQNGVIGASHGGWKGTLHEMAKKMIEKMVEQGAEVSSIEVAVGPSIGQCCYEVKEDLVKEFISKFPKYTSQISEQRDEKWYLNLAYLNYLQLLDAGIQKQNIDYKIFCTKCDERNFYSYRRDYHVDKSLFGEMMSYIIRI